jgi:hypothetical protein
MNTLNRCSPLNQVPPGKYLTTEEFAHFIGAKPGSIRTRLCTSGSYHGVKPRKLPNGRLLWSPMDIADLIGGEL